MFSLYIYIVVIVGGWGKVENSIAQLLRATFYYTEACVQRWGWAGEDGRNPQLDTSVCGQQLLIPPSSTRFSPNCQTWQLTFSPRNPHVIHI